MKKLQRIKLQQVSNDFNAIKDSELAKMLGGTFTSDGQTWYYGSEHEAMLDAGTWTEGYVQDQGYVLGEVSVTPSGSDGISDSLLPDAFEEGFETWLTEYLQNPPNEENTGDYYIKEYCKYCNVVDNAPSGIGGGGAGEAGYRCLVGWLHVWGLHENGIVRDTVWLDDEGNPINEEVLLDED